jgi:hypothetical protein
MSLLFVSKLNTCGLNSRDTNYRTDRATSGSNSCVDNSEFLEPGVALFVVPGAIFCTSKPSTFAGVVG